MVHVRWEPGGPTPDPLLMLASKAAQGGRPSSRSPPPPQPPSVRGAPPAPARQQSRPHALPEPGVPPQPSVPRLCFDRGLRGGVVPEQVLTARGTAGEVTVTRPLPPPPLPLPGVMEEETRRSKSPR